LVGEGEGTGAVVGVGAAGDPIVPQAPVKFWAQFVPLLVGMGIGDGCVITPEVGVGVALLIGVGVGVALLIGVGVGTLDVTEADRS